MWFLLVLARTVSWFTAMVAHFDVVLNFSRFFFFLRSPFMSGRRGSIGRFSPLGRLGRVAVFSWRGGGGQGGGRRLPVPAVGGGGRPYQTSWKRHFHCLVTWNKRRWFISVEVFLLFSLLSFKVLLWSCVIDFNVVLWTLEIELLTLKVVLLTLKVVLLTLKVVLLTSKLVVSVGLFFLKHSRLWKVKTVSSF